MRLLSTVILASLFVLTPATASAQWSDDASSNTAVVTRSGDQALPKSAATSDGGRWVAWFDNASGNYDVYAQRYDSQGNELLAPGGLLISANSQSSSLVNWNLIADSSDHAVLVFTDTRAGGDLDVYAYRIASDGSFLWGANGIPLSSNADFEADPMVAEAANGDFVVVWSFLGSTATVRMQRLTPAGSPTLTLGGLNIVAEAGASPGFPRVIAGSGNDVIVSWVRDINFFTSIKHLRAQAFDAAGAPTWALPVEVHNAYNLPFAYSPQLASDGAGGAILCWHASNPGRGGLFDAFVQHLDSAGTQLLAPGGTLLSSAVGMNHLDPQAAFNPSTGDIIAFWSEKDGSQSQSGWFAQSVSSAGALNWGSNGKQILAVDTATKYLSYVEALGNGAVGVIGWAPSGGFGADEILATRLDAAGTQVWGAPVTIKSTPSNQSTRLSLSVGGEDVAVVFWEDERSGNDDIYAQNIQANGTLGPDYLKLDTAAVSLFFGGTATLSFDAGSAHAGETYLVLGSNTGTAPGVNGRGLHLDLNPGPYFQLTWNNPTHPLFSGFRGTLDGQGRATASVQFPAGSNPALIGEVLGHAVAVTGAGGLGVLASETESFTLLP